ncbi:MAG: trypsin-like peptidase domain-containing protein, partial [Gemmatimonadota bacterium]
LRLFRYTICWLALVACTRSDAQTASDESEHTPSAAATTSAPVTPTTSDAAASAPGALDATNLAQQQSQGIDQSRHSAIVTAAARVAPAVVSVNVERRERLTSLSLWDQFMRPRGSERLVQGLGSGFIASPDGIVITNHHVIEGAERIVVTTRDGTDYEGTLLGEDPLTDIAVLEIDGNNLPTVSFGRSTDLLIGEWVVAIGNPYGYLLGNSEATVTAGVVSATGRDLIPSGDNSGIYVDMIQTDAAINPGNSGGPLVNALGEVVGVNSSIFSNSGGSVGIGFAIPIERARRVADELRRFGTVRRAWVGLDVTGTDELRDWKSTGGLEVTRVAEGSPAYRAGIRRGDIMVAAGVHSMRTFLDWEGAKLDVGPGDSILINYRRGGRERSAVVVVEDLPTSRAERVSILGDMQLITLTPAIRQERGIQAEQGVLVFEVGETARGTRLRPGDVIVQVNRTGITSAEQLTEFFDRVQGRRTYVRLIVERGGGYYITEFYVR